jgi:segregation and condensation protein B
MNRMPRSASALRTMNVRLGNARRPAIHSQFLAPAEPKPLDALGRDAKLAKVEALLMLADEPITSRKIADAAGLEDGHEARRLVERLRELYETDSSPFNIMDVAGGFQLLTKPIYHTWLLRLRRTGHDLRLTPAAWETLAVIAYKQPVMRAEVEAIRGVSCNEMVHLLMEKGLVRIAGRHESLGRPQLFGTTKRFLQYFGLNSLADLPEVGAMRPPKA